MSVRVPYDDFIEALTLNGSRQAGGNWQCPAHDDRNPSLNVKDEAGGTETQFTCYAGCNGADILAALNLKPGPSKDRTPPSWAGFDYGGRKHEYVYTDEYGTALRKAIRRPGKKFHQETADGGKAVAGLRDVLYRLPDVLKAVKDGAPIHLVEGEKDTDALRLEGHVATCNVGGAGNWKDTLADSLKGATEVIVWRDKDEAGQRWATAVAASLAVRGVTHRVVEAAHGKDAYDHLEAGYGIDEAKPVDAPGQAVQTAPERLKVTRADTMQVRAVKWLLQDKIAVGTLSLLSGREGIGKSTIAYSFAAQITQGTLEGQFKGKPRSVIVVATEDSWEHTIVPRLMAAGADLYRVLRVEAFSPEGFEEQLSLPADLPGMKRICQEEDVALIVLDPLMSAVDHKLDTHKDREVRKALDPLVRLADAVNATVIGLIHVNKSQADDPLNAIMGSKAFAAVARSVLTAIADPDEKDRFYLGNPKNNLGRNNLPSLIYSIRGVKVAETGDGDEVWTSAITWLGTEEKSISEVMADTQSKPGQGSTAAECAGWLIEFLDSVGGSAPRPEVLEAAKKERYSESTLKRAASKAKIDIISEGFPRRTTWTRPVRPLKSVDSLSSLELTELTELTEPTGHSGANGSQSAQSAQSAHSSVHGPTMSSLSEPTGRPPRPRPSGCTCPGSHDPFGDCPATR